MQMGRVLRIFVLHDCIAVVIALLIIFVGS